MNAESGVLITCEIPIKQYLLWLDEQQDGVGRRFIRADLDDTHLFVHAWAIDHIKESLNKLYEENQYTFIQ